MPILQNCLARFSDPCCGRAEFDLALSGGWFVLLAEETRRDEWVKERVGMKDRGIGKGSGSSIPYRDWGEVPFLFTAATQTENPPFLYRFVL